MKMLSAIAAALSLVASPAVAQTRCLSAADAESIALVALPEIIRDAGHAASEPGIGDALVRATDQIARQLLDLPQEAE